MTMFPPQVAHSQRSTNVSRSMGLSLRNAETPDTAKERPTVYRASSDPTNREAVESWIHKHHRFYTVKIACDDWVRDWVQVAGRLRACRSRIRLSVMQRLGV